MIAEVDELTNDLKELADFAVEEHESQYTVVVVVMGEFKEVVKYAEDYLRKFCPSKYQTRVLTRHDLNEDGTLVEWSLIRKREAQA